MDMTGGIIEHKKDINLVPASDYNQTWVNFSQMFYKKTMMGCALPAIPLKSNNKKINKYALDKIKLKKLCF